MQDGGPEGSGDPFTGDACHVVHVLGGFLHGYVHQVFHQDHSEKPTVRLGHWDVMQAVPLHEAGTLLLVCERSDGVHNSIGDLADYRVGPG